MAWPEKLVPCDMFNFLNSYMTYSNHIGTKGIFPICCWEHQVGKLLQGREPSVLGLRCYSIRFFVRVGARDRSANCTVRQFYLVVKGARSGPETVASEGMKGSPRRCGSPAVMIQLTTIRQFLTFVYEIFQHKHGIFTSDADHFYKDASHLEPTLTTSSSLDDVFRCPTVN